MRTSFAGRSRIDSESGRRPFQSRGFDLVLTMVSLPLLLPLMGIIALGLFLSGGRIVDRDECVGKDGTRFQRYRFCTTAGGENGRSPNGTRFGRMVQRINLAGLPELFNVLRGEMSLVGPRPRAPSQLDFYGRDRILLLQIRPGIVSPAQLYDYSGYNETAGLDCVQNVQIELAYQQVRTPLTDLSLLLQANAIVVAGRERLKKILGMRNRHFLMIDILSILIIPVLAMSLRMEGFSWWPRFNRALLIFIGAALLIKLSLFIILGLYSRYWAYAGINELMMVIAATGLSTVLLVLLYVGAFDLLREYKLQISRTVPLIDGFLTVFAVGGSRFFLRGLYYWQHRSHIVLGGKQVLIVGAGEAGITAVREMRANPQLGMTPVAFADDDPHKQSTCIEGLLVLGTGKTIPELVRQLHIHQILVAVPSASLPRQREILRICRQTGVPADSLPGMYELLAGNKTVDPKPRIDFNQLLHREPVMIDFQEVSSVLGGRTVLVTGAGGSIGSELCRQLARCNPGSIILLGHGENSIFEIGLNLRLQFPDLKIVQTIVDVRDRPRVEWVVRTYRPNVIFHAAAHKHVPFMEDCVEEAVINNILGSWNVLRAANQYDVGRFVLISTDKAICPVNIMGVTKRIAELLMLATARESGRSYNAVRFGNVLGSRGSVVPIFQRQIAAGGPLTVTHPQMTRYFMTIPEAAQLVLQAAVLGQCGDIFMLDMGDPVRILDLARDLIHRAGLQIQRDIEIVYSGIRPGEKLAEHLKMKGEQHLRTRHKKIFAVKTENVCNPIQLQKDVHELIRLARMMDTEQVLAQIQRIIPEYHNYKRQNGRQEKGAPAQIETAAMENVSQSVR